MKLIHHQSYKVIFRHNDKLINGQIGQFHHYDKFSSKWYIFNSVIDVYKVINFQHGDKFSPQW